MKSGSLGGAAVATALAGRRRVGLIRFALRWPGMPVIVTDLRNRTSAVVD
jgi:hypothetical protein